MLRTHTCGALALADVNKEVTLSGWVQKTRDKGGLIWIDLRDRYGLTQLVMEEGRSAAEVIEVARTLDANMWFRLKGS